MTALSSATPALRPAEIHDAANRAGFRFFADVETFRSYVRQEILASEGEERAAA